MSLGIISGDYLETLTDLGVTVTYSAATRTIDPIYGGETVSYANSTPTWIFFKRNSTIDLTKYGIVDVGDAYVIVPLTVIINYGDRIAFNSETFEYTPECKSAVRYANNTAMYNYYTLKKIV